MESIGTTAGKREIRTKVCSKKYSPTVQIVSANLKICLLQNLLITNFLYNL